jgi:hypothetical protein
LRRFDGFCNHHDADKLAWGASLRQLRRDVTPAYLDGMSALPDQCGYKHLDSVITVVKECPYPQELGGRGSRRPSPRLISNELFHQVHSVPSRRGVNDMFSQWGQFITHDIDHTSKSPRFEFDYQSTNTWIPILIPKGDIHFDVDDEGYRHLTFLRSVYDRLDTCSICLFYSSVQRTVDVA